MINRIYTFCLKKSIYKLLLSDTANLIRKKSAPPKQEPLINLFQNTIYPNV